MAVTVVDKNDDGLVVRLPADMCKQTGLIEGMSVTVEATGEGILIRPVRVTMVGRYRVPDLADLFAAYTGDWKPDEDGFTTPVGNEA